MNELHAVKINPFAVSLLAESVLKSPLAQMTVNKPLPIFFPISRSDCAGWAGVKITVEAVPVDVPMDASTAPAKHTPGPWKSLPDNYSGEMHRMVVNSEGAPLFDSVNRSPAADDSTEHGDLILAAAAPELLEALRGVLHVSDRKTDEFDAANAAITKATGGAQ